MTAKMPMSGSPEKRRVCIALLPLPSPIFRLALSCFVFGNDCAIGGCAPAVPPDARPSSKHQRRAGRKTRPYNLVVRKWRNEVSRKQLNAIEPSLKQQVQGAMRFRYL